MASALSDIYGAAAGLFKQPGRALLLVDDHRAVAECVGDPALCPALGVELLEALPAFIGYEDALDEVAAGSAEPLRLPNVAVMHDRPHDPPRHVDLTAYRDPYSGLAVLIEDASEAARLQQKLMQQYNELMVVSEALEQARDEALEASRAKSAFLANISHELRTPLTVIIGNAEILGKPRFKPLAAQEVAGFADDIRTSGELLLELINDLIDMARAEAGRLELDENWVNLGAVAEACVRYARRLPEADALTLTLEIDPALPQCWCDERRMKQAILNLLSNAVKFTPPGGAIRTRVGIGAEGGACVSVADSGPGLTDDEIEVAMSTFGQVGSRNRHKGAGLGLPIVRALIERHGGSFVLRRGAEVGIEAILTLSPDRFRS